MTFFSTMIMVLLISKCPIHGEVSLEESAIPGAVGVYAPRNVSSEEAERLRPDRELLQAIEHDSNVFRKCPHGDEVLSFKPVKVWHMITPNKKGNIVWERQESQ